MRLDVPYTYFAKLDEIVDLQLWIHIFHSYLPVRKRNV